jgi:RNA polymerase sigma-70 factor (ECF subfamily)
MHAVASMESLPVAAARSGDAGAWDALFRRYQLPLYAFVRELLGEEQASLDVVQESFISATRHLDQLSDDARFGSWLFSIAHQKCLQHWRRCRIPVQTLEDTPELTDLEAPLPDLQLMRQEQEQAFLDAMDRLPPAQRTVILLHALEGFSLETIADITGAPLGTVKSRLHYARQNLQRFLDHML